MYRFERVVSVDFSPVAVEEMSALWPELPSLQWKCLDVTSDTLQTEFGNESFDVVLDKGFLDAYISVDDERLPDQNNYKVCGDRPEKGSQSHFVPSERTPGSGTYDYRKAANDYFCAVMDLLCEGGSFVLISLCEDYILKELVSCG